MTSNGAFQRCSNTVFPTGSNPTKPGLPTGGHTHPMYYIHSRCSLRADAAGLVPMPGFPVWPGTDDGVLRSLSRDLGWRGQ